MGRARTHLLAVHAELVAVVALLAQDLVQVAARSGRGGGGWLAGRQGRAGATTASKCSKLGIARRDHPAQTGSRGTTSTHNGRMLRLYGVG